MRGGRRPRLRARISGAAPAGDRRGQARPGDRTAIGGAAGLGPREAQARDDLGMRVGGPGRGITATAAWSAAAGRSRPSTNRWSSWCQDGFAISLGWKLYTLLADGAQPLPEAVGMMLRELASPSDGTAGGGPVFPAL